MPYVYVPEVSGVYGVSRRHRRLDDLTCRQILNKRNDKYGAALQEAKRDVGKGYELKHLRTIEMLIEDYEDENIGIWDANLTMLKEYARELKIPSYSTYSLREADLLTKEILKSLKLKIRKAKSAK